MTINDSKKTYILCMGGINMDLVIYVHHLPKPGETVFSENFHTFPGGKGGNQAVSAKKLGGKVQFFGKLGLDSFSNELLGELEKQGIDISRMLKSPDKTAGVAMIWVDEKGQNSIAFTPGANAHLTPEEILANESVFRPDGILLITMEIGAENVYAAIRLAKQKGMLVILDPAPAPMETFPTDIPGMVDIVKPNETETEAITGVHVTDFKSAEVAMSKLISMGFKTPIITMGNLGALAYFDEKMNQIPPLKVDSIDSTAAGDVFSGALAASIYSGKSIKSALEFSSVASALSTTVKGTQSSIPSLQEIETLLLKS